MMKKNVLITGAAKRIGRAIARLLHDEGCNILLHYRTSETHASKLCAELNQKRVNSATIIQADLLKINELDVLADKVQTVWGQLDVLVNNASTFFPTPVAQTSESQWDELLDMNLKAPFFLCKTFSKTLAANQGCIVNIVDIHAERGLKSYPVYSIAKAGLVAMTKILAKELAPDIRVNAVSPGAILWPETPLSDIEKQDIVSRVALRRNGEPFDIAKAVRFLIADADYVTGEIITVDGGRTLFC